MHRPHPFVAGTVGLGFIAYMAGLVWDASFGTIVMIVNLLVDVTYGLINPRIRYTR